MLETIIVSTNYDDLLDVTLPHNKPLVDRLVVGTSSKDLATIEVCKKHGVEIIFCDEYLTKNNTVLNRGAAYNHIFNHHIRHQDWILLLDSDVLINRIDTSSLDNSIFYGSRRWNLETYKQYEEVKLNPRLLTKDNFTLYRGAGYGYFQLFNYKSPTFQKLLPKPYIEKSGVSENDWVFRNNWGWEIFVPHPPGDIDHSSREESDYGCNNFRILPEHVIHLGVPGKNDTSRNTPKFSREQS